MESRVYECISVIYSWQQNEASENKTNDIILESYDKENLLFVLIDLKISTRWKAIK